jgi:hypothetical protein
MISWGFNWKRLAEIGRDLMNLRAVWDPLQVPPEQDVHRSNELAGWHWEYFLLKECVKVQRLMVRVVKTQGALRYELQTTKEL